jgi:uncharacterized RDD family membrane protein YckC
VTPRYAGLVSRTLAWVTDVLILALLITGTDWFAQELARQVIGGGHLDPGRCAAATRWWSLRSLLCHGVPRVPLLAATFLPALYQVGFWSVIGQTPGMALFGLRLLRTDGRPIHLGTALLRYLGILATGLTFGLGFLLLLGSSRRQALQDRVARTVVVHDWMTPVPRAWEREALEPEEARDAG